MGDEIGGNILMKGYGYIGGRLHFAAKGKTTSKDTSKLDTISGEKISSTWLD